MCRPETINPGSTHFAALTAIFAANWTIGSHFAAQSAILAANRFGNCHFAALTIILAANQTQSAAAVSGKTVRISYFRSIFNCWILKVPSLLDRNRLTLKDSPPAVRSANIYFILERPAVWLMVKFCGV